ncbi:MAG: glycosyltransferase family A protein [Gemmatimonadota bacterium]
MGPTRITAVIPAFNAAASIGSAIRSVLAQSRVPDELIVVDDGSTDGTPELAEAAGARVIRQANAGPGAARNAGIASAEADWIALLDADDAWRPDRIERQLAALEADRVAVVYSGHEVADGRKPPMPPAAMDFAALWERNRIPTSTVMLRKAAWEEVGGFDESRDLIGVEDYNLWLRLTASGWKLVGIDARLVDYQPTTASLTRQTRRFARAELTHLTRIADRLGLDPELVNTKEFALYLEYGMEFFYYRDREAAREFLREASRRGPLPLSARVRYWATHLPFTLGSKP